jgi:hypothetical protein
MAAPNTTPTEPETTMHCYLIKFDDGAKFYVDAINSEEARDIAVEMACESLDVIGTVVWVHLCN